MLKLFRFYQYSSQISSLNNIILYTQQNQSSYETYCIYFVSGYRLESIKQQGSLICLKHIKDIETNNFLFQSQAIQNINCQLESYQIQNLFLNEDFDLATQFICKEAFQCTQMNKGFKQLRQLVKDNKNQKFNIEMQRIILEQFCLQKYTAQMIPECADFQMFQQTQITPHNCIIGYNGYRSHQEVFDTLEKNMALFPEFMERKFESNYYFQQYQSKTIRIENDMNSEFEIALIFSSSSCQDEQIVLIDTILAEILGRINDTKIDLGIKIKSRCYDKLLQYNQDILFEAGCLQENFSDFGFFSLILNGLMNEKRKIYDLAIEEMQKLKKISDNEIQRAKNIAITKFYNNLQRQHEKLSFDLKNIHTLGQIIDIQDYKIKINQVTKQQIEQRVNQLLKQDKLILIYRGKGVDVLPDEKMTLMRLNY